MVVKEIETANDRNEDLFFKIETKQNPTESAKQNEPKTKEKACQVNFRKF